MNTRFRSSSNFLPTVILVALFAMPALMKMTWAASCHGGGGGQSLTSLSTSQQYQLGMSSSYRVTGGHFDPYGDYTSNPAGSSGTVKSMMLGASFRISDELQAAISLPIISNERTFPHSRTSATGAGDPILEARYSVLDDLGFLPFQPQLDLTGGMRLPMARSVYGSSDPYGTDVFGDGIWLAHLGASASKRRGLIKLGLDGAFSYPILKTITEMRGLPLSRPQQFKSGNRLQLQESLSLLFSHRWSAGLSLKQQWQLRASRDSVSLAGSASRLFLSSANVNFSPSPWLSLAAAFETVAPFYRYLANQPNFQSVSLTATYSGY